MKARAGEGIYYFFFWSSSMMPLLSSQSRGHHCTALCHFGDMPSTGKSREREHELDKSGRSTRQHDGVRGRHSRTTFLKFLFTYEHYVELELTDS